MLLLLGIIQLFGILQALGARVEVGWDVGYLNISRDGYSTWLAVGVNGRQPIAPVYVDEGDTLLLNVRNSLDKPISLHAHGLFQRNTTYYDGVGMVTECGIPPGESFTYVIDTGGQTGTFWIHGHYGSEVADGLRAPFIIREKAPAVQYDEDVLITLEDWLQMPYDLMGARAQQIRFDQLFSNYPTVLINGIDGNKSQPIHFVPGKRYRLRIASMSVSYWFKFRLPGHKLEIVESDGIAIEPLAVDGLDMCPGQRYSVLVTAHDTDAFNFRFNVTFYADYVPKLADFNPRHYEIPLVYREGAPTRRYAIVGDDKLVWQDEFAMVPRNRQPLLEPVNRRITVSKQEHTPYDGFGLPTYSLGDYAYTHPMVPSLITALTTGDWANNSLAYGPQTNTHVVEYMEVVELMLVNPSGKDHSIHMHGYVFQVVELGPMGNASATQRTAPKLKRAGQWPMRRDTVTFPAYSYLALRFLADSPFVALVHCHAQQHKQRGMSFTLVVAPELLQQTQRMPEKMLEFCRKLG
ncbi:ferroxidase fet3, partial [Coemansia sp. RSA 2705]